MALVIDTNVAIHLRDRDSWVLARLASLGQTPVISIMSLVELEAGVLRNPDLTATRRAVLDAMLEDIQVLELDREIITVYGRIVATLGFSRARVIDRLIAATAIVNRLPLVTINGDNFRGIPDLDLEVWTTPAQ